MRMWITDAHYQAYQSEHADATLDKTAAHAELISRLCECAALLGNAKTSRKD